MTRAPAIGLALVAGCIIPDRDIRIDPGFDNEGAVRIVQRPPRTPEMNEICNAEKDFDLAYCPEVRGTMRSGLIRAIDGGDFCVCPGGDNRRINGFEIYAEDGDVVNDRAEDTLYGVALLDLERSAENPNNFVAYENYWEPGAEGKRIEVGEAAADNRTVPPYGRESTQVWAFALDDGTGSNTLDLCNDDNGDEIEPGLHNLRFMVTDRPFFRPAVLDENGDRVGYGPTQYGVPDLAAGATYATIDFVFECEDAALDVPGCEPIPLDEDTPMCTCNCSSEAQ